MREIIQIARTEVLEHRRQPWMLFILVANYGVWICIFGALFLILDRIAGNAETLVLFKQRLDGFGVGFNAVLKLLVSSFSTILLTTLPLVVAFLSGTSVLHDRECGTMPFLMLAPITRWQLLAGKLVGAMTFPLVFHLLFVGSSCLLLGSFALFAPFSHQFGASASFWIAFLVGAPASAAFVGALGTVISALSRDIRTSMQYTSFFIGLLSLGIEWALVNGISQGIGLQIAFATGCILATALTLFVGARLISRDVASV